MKEYVWLFPVLFIIHEFEEIIGFGKWYERNKKKLKERYPKVVAKLEKMFDDYSTEGMAVAVLEEFILCFAVCCASLYFENYYLWIGIFIAFILHMIMHIGQALLVKGYVPSIITSCIEIIPCTILVRKCIGICNLAPKDVFIASILGVAVIGINVKFAHFLLHSFTKWMDSK